MGLWQLHQSDREKARGEEKRRKRKRKNRGRAGVVVGRADTSGVGCFSAFFSGFSHSRSLSLFVTKRPPPFVVFLLLTHSLQCTLIQAIYFVFRV